MTTHATLIRDAIITRVKDMDMDSGLGESLWKTVAQNPAGTMRPDELPFIGVFMMRERMTPDGDGNAGEPKFIHDATIGISIVNRSGKPDPLDDDLDDKAERVLTALLTDATFVTFGDGALFESIEAVERTRIFPVEGSTYYAELRIGITFRFRTYWPPVITDDLEGITVSARPMLNPNAPLIERHIINIEETP